VNTIKMMTGNQAVARGFYEAGGHVAASYPGSPTVEMLETIKHNYPEIYAEFSVNEKVALEVCIGSSMAGARSIVSMKHVGVNVAADPLLTFTETRTKGGFLLMSGDDPGMASSQNEQDNRILAKFANMPIFDPSDSQEAKDYTKLGLQISERYETPVMLRITSRICHSRTQVELSDRLEMPIAGFKKNPADYGMIPPNTFDKQYHMKTRIEALQADLETLGVNQYEPYEGAEVLVITSGLPYQNLKELDAPVSIYKLGIVYPLPIEPLRALSKAYKKVIVVEEMMPFIEDQIKLAGFDCEGKKYFSFTGELDVADIEKGLIEAGVALSGGPQITEDRDAMGRLPMFCSGCPHRPVFDILKKTKTTVVGDIGCYSMGILYPLEVLDSIISMGASLGMIKGMKKAQRLAGNNEPLVSIIGDGTFYHSGMTGLLNLLHQYDPTDNMTVIILNNGTTAMTGGQPNASSSAYKDGSDMHVDMIKLIETMGFDRIKVVDQFNYKEAKATIDDEIRHEGLSIVITTRPCALKFKIKSPNFYVDPKICIGCRTCVKTNCPPIHMKAYEGIEKLKSSIDPSMCVGCSICSQVCPVNAIKRREVIGHE
jgi:indolepyruvate ferredoxin oxidoreductase alpha subunit